MAKNVVIGTAPDSWGVWFADDPHQTPAERFLDEVVQAGYEWIEIGSFGYLPTDPAQLRDALASRRNLKVPAARPSPGSSIRTRSTRSGRRSPRSPR